MRRRVRKPGIWSKEILNTVPAAALRLGMRPAMGLAVHVQKALYDAYCNHVALRLNQNK